MKKFSSWKISRLLLVILIAIVTQGVSGQVYLHGFDLAPSGPPFTDPPNIGEPDLINSSWTNSLNVPFASFAGSSGGSLCITNNTSGTFTFTLTVDVNPGKSLTLSAFNFWHRRSGNGPANWAMTINGTSVGSGTTPAAGVGATVGLTAFTPITNLTGTVTVILTLSNSPGANGTYRVDDFQLNGSVADIPALIATSPTGFGNVCINTLTGANTFSLSGSNMNGSNVVIGPLPGYSFSANNGLFTSTLTLMNGSGPGYTYSGGILTSTVYVKFNPTAVQSYNGNIQVVGGGANTINVPITGSGVNTKPDITDGTAGSITTNSAVITVTVNSNGCSPITGYGAEYSTTPNFLPGTGTPIASGNLSGGVYTVNLIGLAPPGQIFYVHTYATNAGGTIYGNEISFILLAVTPTLTVPSAGAGSLAAFGSVCINSFNTNSFSLYGSALNNSAITVGPLAGYTFSTTAGGTYSSSLSLVTGGSGYSYSGGVITATIYVKFLPSQVQSYSGNIPVTGGGAPSINVPVSGSGINNGPTVVTMPALFVTGTSATLSGNITIAACGVNYSYGISYSTTPGFAPATGTQVVSTNLGNGIFTVDMSALSANTTYYYYAFVITGVGTTYGGIMNFTTANLPTIFAIVSVNPTSPTVDNAFSVTVEAQDGSGNPVAVSTNTNVTFNLASGAGSLTSQTGTIVSGSSFVTVYGLSHNTAGSISINATGGLANSANYPITIAANSVGSSIIWNSSSAQAWLNGGNWTGGVEAGSGSNVSAKRFDIATFNAVTPSSNSVSINMGTVSGNFYLGTIYTTNNYTGTQLLVGNSSTGTSGILNLFGNYLANAGGSGNNISNCMLANYGSNASCVMEVRNFIGTGMNMTLNLTGPGTFAVTSGRTINVNVLMTGSQPLSITGGGTVSLQPTGAGTVNTFSGDITVEQGILVTGGTGAFSSSSPNKIFLGKAATAGILRLNGKDVTIGGLSTSGSAGTANIVDNGNASATLTINNGTGNVFGGALKDGSSGTLSLVKNGAGILSLAAINTYTGSTTVNNGTLQLNASSGGTLPSSSSIVVNGAKLQVSSAQTIVNLTLNAGSTLIVDAGVALTITGTYTANGTVYIRNNGTIILNGTALQTFPGTAAIISNMNNLQVNNISGVNLNNSINVAGTLTLTNGNFTVGANTLTLNNAIGGISNNLQADNTSSMVIAGSTAISIPNTVTQLKNLTVSNSSASALSLVGATLTVSGTFYVTSTAGTLNLTTKTLNGTANVVMTGGILQLAKQAVMLPELTGAYLLTGGTVTFAGAGFGANAQTIRPVNYYNLTSSSVGDRILPSGETIGIANVFTVGTNAYTVTGSTVNYNGGTQNITGLAAGFTYYHLTLTGGGGVIKSLSNNINIRGTLSIAANTFMRLGNFNATLRSDATNTANVGKILTDNTFIYNNPTGGRFIVERYIPPHNKAWQLLAIPTDAQNIRADWQENSAPLANGNPGYGTTIVSDMAGAVSRGYDFYSAVNSTMKTWAPATSTWVNVDDGVTSTSAVPTYNKKGYILLVRGDRSIITNQAVTNATTMRTKGKLFSLGSENPPQSTTIGTNQYESIGNPYASAIDFGQVTRTGNVQNNFYVWDPLLTGNWGLGGWQSLYDSAGYYIPTIGGTATYPASVPVKIQSGQAFMVRTLGGSGTVSFTENCKESTNKNLFRPGGNKIEGLFRTTLYAQVNGTFQISDGNLTAFDNNYKDKVDADDVLKLNNGGENLGLVRDNEILTMDARKQLNKQDTIHFKMWNMRRLPYRFIFRPQDMDTRFDAFLMDRYTNTSTPVSLSANTTVDFVVNTDAGSYAPYRFYIIFKQKKNSGKSEELVSSLKETSTANESHASVKVFPNPVANKQLSFTVTGVEEGSQYTLQLINTAGVVVFTKILAPGIRQSVKLPASLSSGIYQLTLTEGNDVLVETIMIQ